MSKLVILKETNYMKKNLFKAIEKCYRNNIIEFDETNMDQKEIKTFVEEELKNSTVIRAKNGGNVIRYRGYYGSETAMVNTIIKMGSGRKIGFIRNKNNTYTSVVDDMYMSDKEWQTLGETYADITVTQAASMYDLSISKKKSKKKSSHYQKDENLIYEIL